MVHWLFGYLVGYLGLIASNKYNVTPLIRMEQAFPIVIKVMKLWDPTKHRSLDDGR